MGFKIRAGGKGDGHVAAASLGGREQQQQILEATKISGSGGMQCAGGVGRPSAGSVQLQRLFDKETVALQCPGKARW